jgi:hypothetical protein
MAKVCTNIAGLSKALLRDESLDNPNVFKDFTIGFTQGKASFEFVDVGHGKERADSKIGGIPIYPKNSPAASDRSRINALASSKSQL